MEWKPFWHRPGMRNIKTAVAVVICFLLFLPFWSQTSPAGEGGVEIGPFYACITAVICMQSSVEQSVRQGVSRVIGTLMGGALGLLVLVLYDVTGQHALVMALLLGLGCVAIIWLCNTVRRPAACSLGCIVLCVVMLNHSGADRYLYLLIRVGETLAGIVVAVAVNHLLPDRRGSET
ncbi:hypothetical protein CE91St41_22990 [Oscillospiraceae bacterium]|nr:hypothetical protein CE91St40_14550 [Oscillospiraceae bacterium]BDF75410.1 hypothetical protein CE91St41_22990 [Oscillospiraceae bacterium]